MIERDSKREDGREETKGKKFYKRKKKLKTSMLRRVDSLYFGNPSPWPLKLRQLLSGGLFNVLGGRHGGRRGVITLRQGLKKKLLLLRFHPSALPPFLGAPLSRVLLRNDKQGPLPYLTAHVRRHLTPAMV